MQYLEVIFLLISFVAVLVVAFVVTKNIGRLKSSGQKNMHIIEVLPVAFGQYLYIIEVGGAYHLFSGNKERLVYCTQLEDIEISPPEQVVKEFDKYFNKFIKDKDKE